MQDTQYLYIHEVLTVMFILNIQIYIIGAILFIIISKMYNISAKNSLIYCLIHLAVSFLLTIILWNPIAEITDIININYSWNGFEPGIVAEMIVIFLYYLKLYRLNKK